MPIVAGLPDGFTYTFDSVGNVVIVPPAKVKNVVSQAHDAMTTAGSMIPAPMAIGATIGASPAIYQAGVSLVTAILLHDPVGIITNGVPLAAGLVSAGYAIFSKTQRPTHEQITNRINSMSNDELVSLLKRDGQPS